MYDYIHIMDGSDRARLMELVFYCFTMGVRTHVFQTAPFYDWD